MQSLDTKFYNTGLHNSVNFRDSCEEDLPIIVDCIYHALKTRRDLIKLLLAKPNTNTTVACTDADNNQVIGFIVSDVLELCIHFIYIKLPFRKLGIAEALINSQFIECNPKFYSLNLSVPDYAKHKIKIRFKPVLLLSVK